MVLTLISGSAGLGSNPSPATGGQQVQAMEQEEEQEACVGHSGPRRPLPEEDGCSRRKGWLQAPINEEWALQCLSEGG